MKQAQYRVFFDAEKKPCYLKATLDHTAFAEAMKRAKTLQARSMQLEHYEKGAVVTATFSNSFWEKKGKRKGGNKNG